jgi:hypothetical protein
MAVLPEVLLRYREYEAQTTNQKQGSIENSRCAISLTTARRRAGQPEGVEEVIAWAEGLSPADYSFRVAERCLAEGYWEPAAYRARRALALNRSPILALQALWLATKATRLAPPAERTRISRMFLGGPVRALGLRPA